ncbi:hypothetical protein L208DRAFT_1355266 [Tricholoma matsutake]|nr:hypothetical protein L208DRAFT_1355266 [Tricholoma matsutake 945]
MRYIWLLTFLVLSLSAAWGGRINVTIDDYFGDSKTGSQITYLPVGAWVYGPSCPNCAAHPEPKNAHLGTWHVGTFNGSGKHDAPLLSATVPFYGSAIYVYCIVSDTDTSSSVYSDLTFQIDFLPVGTFAWSSLSRNVIQYNALVFAHESLSMSNHTLIIQKGQLGGSKSAIMLDYIVYSYDVENSFQLKASNLTTTGTTSPSNDRRCTVIGGVLGSIIVLLLVLVVFLYRRQKSTTPSAPFGSTSSNIAPGQLFSRYVRRPRFPRSETPSQLSFHPSLLVNKRINGDRVQISPPSPIPYLPPHPLETSSTVDLTPSPMGNLAGSLNSPDPRSEQAQVLSITEWLKRTGQQADLGQPQGVAFPRNSFDSHRTPESELPPPPRRMQRRFTVMNN